MWFTIILLVAFSYFFYRRYIVPLNHWKKQNVQQSNPIPLFGDQWRALTGRESMHDMLHRLYTITNDKYLGIFQLHMPVLLLKDPGMIKQLCIKDFDYFTDHLRFIPEDSDPIWNRGLFSLKGDRWREMRSTLSPAFTGHKMRSMFELINEAATQFANHFLEKKLPLQEIEMKDKFTRYANDVIATCAFGITVDSLKNPENEFYLSGKLTTKIISSVWFNIKIFLGFIIPPTKYIWKIQLIPEKAVNFFKPLLLESVKLREEKNIIRPDVINVLMEARKGKLDYTEENMDKETNFAVVQESQIGKKWEKKTEISDLDLVAQCVLFFFAGFDTVTTLMSFTAYELALNPEIQVKLIEEIDLTRKANNNKLTYDILAKMKYLDMVISETLRKWPPQLVTDRICVKSYTIPPQTPDEKPITINPGEAIWVPILPIHRDPKYYENPDKFDPERFNEENKKNIDVATYCPFGIGPRACIGTRFAIMETKTVLYHILSHFEFEVTKKTEIPIQLNKTQFNLAAQNGFWLGLKKRMN